MTFMSPLEFEEFMDAVDGVPMSHDWTLVDATGGHEWILVE